MKVIVIDGRVYQLDPVIFPDAILQLIKEKQLEIYVNNCSEPSSEIVEGRVYEI